MKTLSTIVMSKPNKVDKDPANDLDREDDNEIHAIHEPKTIDFVKDINNKLF